MIFAPERMLHVDVLTLCRDAGRVTRLLAFEGSLHIAERMLDGTPLTPRARPSSAGRAPREELDRLVSVAEALLQRLEPPAAGAQQQEDTPFPDESAADVAAAVGKELAGLQQEIDARLQEHHDAEAAVARLDTLSDGMQLLHEHGLSFLELDGFRHFHAACGLLDRHLVPRLAEQLAGEPCAFVTRNRAGREALFLLVGDRAQAARLDVLLRDAGAHPLEPPERFVRSFDEGLEQIEIELWELRDRLAELNRETVGLRPRWQAALSACLARLRAQRTLEEALGRFGSDGTVALISGFVPASRRESLLRRLESEADGLYHARFAPAAESARARVPTRLRNAGLFRPFEMFVRTYGLPGYNDVDPTPFVAVSFLLMFGMMFGDVGHGLVLAAIGAGLAFLPYRAFLAFRDLGRILFMAGLSGALFGFLFGSVFGVEEDRVLPALWMRPSHPENLTTFLGAALGLGVLVISTGIVLNIVQLLRRRDLRKALIGQWSAASLVFFWGLLLFAGLRMTGRAGGVPPAAVAMLLAVPLAFVGIGQLALHALDARRHTAAAEEEDEEGEELATLLFEPIEIVMNLFTNSVSFLRVAAFGLAHAALTMATFVIKDMLRAPGAGVLTVPVEHLFIIVLEGMIVTIQCLRLEYYEFFSKFFGGAGTAYEPLALRRDADTRT